MKQLLLFIALIYSSFACAQPAGDGALIKTEIINRIASLQAVLNAEMPGLVNFNVEDYQVGDKSSTANLAYTLTSPTSKKSFSGKIKLDIMHGPEFMLDNVKTKGLALVNSSIAASERNPTPVILLSTVIDKNSPDWKINLILPGHHMDQLIDWNGAKGQLMLRYNNNKVNAAAFALVWQQMTINIPGKFQLFLAPFEYKAGFMQQDENSMEVLQETNLNGMQISTNGTNAFSFKGGKLTMSSNMKDKITSEDRMMSLTGVETNMLGDLKFMPNINVHLQVKNFMLNMFEQSKMLMSGKINDDKQEILSALLPNSELDFDTTIETNLGNFTCSIKLTLNSMPKDTGPEFIKSMDVNVNVFIANKLLTNFVTMANEYAKMAAMYRAQMASPTATPPTAPPMPDMMSEVDKLVKSGVLVQTKDGYTFSFIKQNEKMQLNGNEQSPYLEMLRQQAATPVKLK